MLETEIRSATNENRSISKQIEWYNDPAHLEEKAKKELNLRREGEEVIVIIDDKTVSTTIASSSQKFEDKRSWWDIFN